GKLGEVQAALRGAQSALEKSELTQAQQTKAGQIQNLQLTQQGIEVVPIVCANALIQPSQSGAEEFARRVAELATRMSGLATSISTSELFKHSAPYPRAALVKLTTILGESANQLSARADVLARQYRGIEATKLSTGDHLRDSSVTGFLSL